MDQSNRLRFYQYLRTMLVFREAKNTDVDRIANLHAQSWQQNYRGSFSDEFLDNEVLDDRLAVWHERFNNPKENQHIVIAEENGLLLGFICSYFKESPIYGTYLDNLHVSDDAKGKGIGTKLMGNLAQEINGRNYKNGFYLWVLNANYAAISFYDRIGGKSLETVEANDIGDTVFQKTRYVWKDMNEFLKMVNTKIRIER